MPATAIDSSMDPALTPPTAQQVFNRVWKWFIIDKHKPAINESSCVYRGNLDPRSPLRCGIGCVLPDALYSPELEGRCIDQLVSAGSPYSSPEFKAFFAQCDLTMLWDIQSAHDQIARTDTIARFYTALAHALTEVQVKYNLLPYASPDDDEFGLEHAQATARM